MLRYLHSLSAVLFYLLGGSMFALYQLTYNGIAVTTSMEWMRIGTLPLLLAGMLFGGLSIYQSLAGNEGRSWKIGLLVGLPLLCLFVIFVSINFRPLP